MIDGKVFAIHRARAEAQHAAQTSRLSQNAARLSQENATLHAEAAAAHRLREENVMMRALLREAVTVEDVTLSDSWRDRAKALLGIRTKKTKRKEP